MVGGGAAFAPLYAPYNHCAHILVPHTAVTQGVKHERCTPGLLTETQHPSLKATPSKNTCWPKKLRICSSSSKHVHLHVLCGCSINIYATEVLSCLEFGSMDSSVVRLPGSWSKGLGFESQQENLLLQGQLSVLTLISVSTPHPHYHKSTYKILVIQPKVQVAGYD